MYDECRAKLVGMSCSWAWIHILATRVPTVRVPTARVPTLQLSQFEEAHRGVARVGALDVKEEADDGAGDADAAVGAAVGRC